jgi:YesN/AraC family two-component response regulator
MSTEHLHHDISIFHDEKISYQEFLHREYNIIHAPYQPEMEFYGCIKNGDVAKVLELCKEPFHTKPGFGTLSKNPVQSLKYHFVISTAMIARMCINQGLQLSESYNMSDYYIQRVDKAKTLKEISELHDEMCIAYTKKMRKLQKASICSKPVITCIDYIYDHLSTRITTEDLSEATGLSSSYISRIFKKETGCTVSEYILLKKIETAKSMLAHSNYSIAQISDALAFPSQSYFTKVFRKYCGTTPKKYTPTGEE